MSMICQWCGLESSDEETCEWCRRPIMRPDPADLGAPPDADPADQQEEDEEDHDSYIAPLSFRLDYFMGLVLPAIALHMYLAHVKAVPLFLLLCGVSFAVCFFLSVYQMVESVDERYAPAGLGLVVFLLFGPIVTVILFGLVGLLVRRAEAWTVVGLVAAHVVAVFFVTYAGVPEFKIAWARAGLTLTPVLANLAFVAGMTGWAAANFWRPLNE